MHRRHLTAVGGVTRRHLAAVRASGGGLEGWDPAAGGSLGASGAAVTGGHLAFGDEFTVVTGENHLGVMQFSGIP